MKRRKSWWKEPAFHSREPAPLLIPFSFPLFFDVHGNSFIFLHSTSSLSTYGEIQLFDLEIITAAEFANEFLIDR